MPYELEIWDQPDSTPAVTERLKHVRNCPFCSLLLNSAEPDLARLGQFLEQARSLTLHEPKAAKDKRGPAEANQQRSKIAS
jgi:hypothetical protein